MPDSILVIVEQREGKLNRVSWETLTAGQALAAETGWTLEAAVAGSGVTSFANEIAGKKVAKVYAIESPKLEPYTPDAFVGRAEAVHRVETAQTGADAAHLSGARFCAQAGDGDGAHRRSATASATRKTATSCSSPARCSRASWPPTSASPAMRPGSSTFQNGAFRGDKVEAGASARAGRNRQR